MREMKSGSIIVAVGALVRSGDGRILLVRHRPDHGGYWAGKWICPGGRLKVGELITQCACREVLEETGLEITLENMMSPFERIVKKKGKTELHVVYIDFLARCSSTSAAPGADVGEVRWVDPGEIDEIAEELHEDTLRLLKLAGVWDGVKDEG